MTAEGSRDLMGAPRGRPGLWLTTSILGLLFVLSGAPARAQFSPGDLAWPHAELEGNTHCLDCHEPKQGVSSKRCLDCHQILRQRIDRGRGLHAGPDFERCETCHIEHNGREFELVWWGEAGRDAFDHSETGHVLEAAHAELECGDCHQSELIGDPTRLTSAGKSLDRTYLGLGTACLDCHADEHRGQFRDRGCVDCHTQTAWKPASGFDHDRTDYPLTGRHRSLTCAACHPAQRTDDGADFLRFAGLPHTACADCHRDPHAGRLGPSCTSCHSTSGWVSGARQDFDHDQTRYPLRGRHADVRCEGCHSNGSTLRVGRFERCRDCHADPHAGQLAGLPDRGACDSCHTVDGFAPSQFGLARHQESGFALEGAHLAVACDQCHTTSPLRDLVGQGLASRQPRIPMSQQTVRFRFPSTTCLDCHGDPHEGQAERIVTSDGCLGCHTVDDWREIEFDHGRTDFLLEGAHGRATCRGCHPSASGASGTEILRMKDLPTACEDCHDDPHLGQLSAPWKASGTARPGVSPCVSCHGVEAWRDLNFDHDRDARFALGGAHATVACAGCHPTETSGGDPVVRYRPLPVACEDCHR